MRDPIDRPLVDRLGERLSAGLDEVVPPGEPVALVDFPNHGNIGDSLIWLGELAWLRASERELAYAADHTGFCAPELERRLPPGGTILLHGGGNFGDLWPVYQRFREQVITRFPRHRIVQLPQTLHFRDPAGLRRTAALLGAHPDVTVCARDAPSERIARERLGARTRLLPDMAFALGPLEPGPASHERLCLLREDGEQAEGRVVPAGERVDWPERGAPWRALRQLTRVVGKAGSVLPPLARASASALGAGYERLARERLEQGLLVVGGGELLVTDRLHGHILALLAGVPHVLLDNSYGKLRGFWDAWTSPSASARLAEDPVPAPA